MRSRGWDVVVGEERWDESSGFRDNPSTRLLGKPMVGQLYFESETAVLE
jgi:hypothetical protein